MSSATATSLYSRDVLRLATSLPHEDGLAEPHGTATRRSPVCGSEMSVDLAFESGKVSALAFRARACALGQASAAILRDAAIGWAIVDVELAYGRVRNALTGNGEMPVEWSALAYARDYPARHGAIFLPFDTLLAAMKS